MSAPQTQSGFKSPPVPQGDLPIGTIVPFGGVLDLAGFEHDGWLYCNGKILLRASYPDLFSVIGTGYGAGDGQTTFAIPDLRGSFLRGVSGSSHNDPDAASRTAAAAGGNPGNAVGSVQGYATGRPVTAFVTNTAGSHTHTADHIPTDKSGYAVQGYSQTIWHDGSLKTAPTGRHSHQVNGGGDAESRPRNVSCYFLIKYRQA